jgi:PAS domain S-box-containing protein
MLDPNGIIISWNTGAERAKGYTASEIIGKPLAILYTPQDAAAGKPQRLMQKALADGSAEDEGWRIRKDGSRFWANVTLTALWEHGELRGFAKITRDMTERRHAEEVALSLELERIARVEAERANALKMRFLAMISHELRTPLTSIKGFTSTLLAEDVAWVPEQQRQFLSLVDQQSDRLRELIDQLLDLSQIQAGVLQIRAIAQPFSASLDVAREQLRTLTVNQDFQANVPEHLPTVFMDERRIAQVVTNIIGNAAKYAPPGTPIVLATFAVDGMVQVEIHDEGPGIPAERRESIFQAFDQVDSKPNRRDGAGLGLAICKGIVVAHGGRIWVKDEPRSGTTLSFTLPVAKANSEAKG